MVGSYTGSSLTRRICARKVTNMSSTINAIRNIIATDITATLVSGEYCLGLSFTDEEGVDQFYPLGTQWEDAIAALSLCYWASAALAIREYLKTNPEVKEEIKDLFNV
jgi:hypothetical protein